MSLRAKRSNLKVKDAIASLRSRAHSKKEVAGRENSSGSASTKKVCHCEERKRRSNLDRKDCFASLAMTRSHLWGVATILANTFFRECTLARNDNFWLLKLM